MFSIFSSTQLSSDEVARLVRVEHKLDLILKHLGVEYDPAGGPSGLADEVRRLADAGEKIQAIKVHRELTGSGLSEAKLAVEAYLRR